MYGGHYKQIEFDKEKIDNYKQIEFDKEEMDNDNFVFSVVIWCFLIINKEKNIMF